MQSIVSATTHQFHELEWNIDHLVGDVEYDIWLENSPHWYMVGLTETQRVTLPEEIEFEGFEDMLQETDYPCNKQRWPIMSRRMLDVLLAVKDFSHQAISIKIADVTGIYDRNINDLVRSDFVNHDFVLVQLLEHQDIFDWENSIYRSDEDLTGLVRSAKQIILKEPENGFPPIFRVSAIPSTLLVSDEGRLALENEGIRGVSFLKLKNY